MIEMKNLSTLVSLMLLLLGFCACDPQTVDTFTDEIMEVKDGSRIVLNCGLTVQLCGLDPNSSFCKERLEKFIGEEVELTHDSEGDEYITDYDEEIIAYARVTNANDVKACLYAKHSPVMIICNIYDSFWGTKSDGIVSNDIKGTKPEFSHAMTIVGWKKIGNANYWIVQNSWGTGWADKGYCYICQGSVIISDLYTITDMKNIK